MDPETLNAMGDGSYLNLIMMMIQTIVPIISLAGIGVHDAPEYALIE